MYYRIISDKVPPRVRLECALVIFRLAQYQKAQCVESQANATVIPQPSPVETQETSTNTAILLGRLLSFIFDYPNGDFVPGEEAVEPARGPFTKMTLLSGYS